ncbi:MAG: glycoside hydrolase family 36 N-terminal domain-containing protein [Waltera sp.]
MQDSGLPHSYSEEETDSAAKCLQIVLQDATNHLELQLFYTVYEDCDVDHPQCTALLNRS